MVKFEVSRVVTAPFDGQKPGTSGLRKKVLPPSSSSSSLALRVPSVRFRLSVSPVLLDQVSLLSGRMQFRLVRVLVRSVFLALSMLSVLGCIVAARSVFFFGIVSLSGFDAVLALGRAVARARVLLINAVGSWIEF